MNLREGACCPSPAGIRCANHLGGWPIENLVPILTGWGLTLAMLATLIIYWWLYNLLQICIGFCIGSPGSPLKFSAWLVNRPRLSCCDLWAQWSRVLNRKQMVGPKSLLEVYRMQPRWCAWTPAGADKNPAFRRKMNVKFQETQHLFVKCPLLLLLIIINYYFYPWMEWWSELSNIFGMEWTKTEKCSRQLQHGGYRMGSWCLAKLGAVEHWIRDSSSTKIAGSRMTCPWREHPTPKSSWSTVPLYFSMTLANFGYFLGTNPSFCPHFNVISNS